MKKNVRIFFISMCLGGKKMILLKIKSFRDWGYSSVVKIFAGQAWRSEFWSSTLTDINGLGGIWQQIQHWRSRQKRSLSLLATHSSKIGEETVSKIEVDSNQGRDLMSISGLHMNFYTCIFTRTCTFLDSPTYN